MQKLKDIRGLYRIYRHNKNPVITSLRLAIETLRSIN